MGLLGVDTDSETKDEIQNVHMRFYLKKKQFVFIIGMFR